jgi:FkbM family methyltransferase
MNKYTKDYQIINKFINIEKKLNKFFFKTDFNFRKKVTDSFISENLSKRKVYNKKINNVNFYFNLSSYITRSALLLHSKKPKHLFEPQTTRLLSLINNNPSSIIIAGAFIGDHACLLAKQNKKSTIYAFEPNKMNYKFLKKNKYSNKLDNLKISNKCLYKNDTTYLKLKMLSKVNRDQAFIGSEREINTNKSNTVSIDNFIKKNNIINTKTILADVEGNEFNILKGALKTLNKTCQNIIFEVHSQYLDFSNGLINLKVIKYLEKLNFKMYAIRDDWDNVGEYKKIELINLNKVYYKGPPHGFNILATRNKKILTHKDIVILNKTLSPKYLLYKKSYLYHPVIN